MGGKMLKHMNIIHLSSNHYKYLHRTHSKLIHYHSKENILESHLLPIQLLFYKALRAIIVTKLLLHQGSLNLDCLQ